MSERCRTKLAGVSHRNDDGTDRQSIIADCTVGERLQMIRESSNRYDRNAIKVCRVSRAQLGYINAHLASDLAPEMDGGYSYYAIIDGLTGGTFDRPTRGVNVVIHHEVADDQATGRPSAPPRQALADAIYEYASAITESFSDGYVASAELDVLRKLGKRLSNEQLKAAHAIVFSSMLRTIALDAEFSKQDEAMTAGVRKVLEALGWCP